MLLDTDGQMQIVGAASATQKDFFFLKKKEKGLNFEIFEITCNYNGVTSRQVSELSTQPSSHRVIVKKSISEEF